MAGPLAGVSGPVADRLARAHRGLFVVDRPPTDDLVLMRDLWSGAELFVRVIDEAQGVVLAHAEGPFDGRVVGTPEGSLTLLPGAFHHPAESLALLDTVLEAARTRDLGTAATLDALLRMELVFRASSRVKVTFAYRTEGLSRP